MSWRASNVRPYILYSAKSMLLTLWAPSVRELSAKLTEGEAVSLAATKSKALSPTRFAGAPSQRGPFYVRGFPY